MHIVQVKAVGGTLPGRHPDLITAPTVPDDAPIRRATLFDAVLQTIGVLPLPPVLPMTLGRDCPVLAAMEPSP